MRKSLAVSMMALGLLLTLGSVAQAKPSWGVSCKGCHGAGEVSRPGALEVTGEGMLDLGALNVPNPTRGLIPFFTVAPGGSVDLTMNVLDGSDVFAVEIKRFEKAGVLGPVDVDFLTGYGADAGWVAQDDGGTAYFTSTGDTGDAWGGATVPHTFTLTVDANTPLNTYDLEYAVAGLGDPDPGLGRSGRFYGDQHFYLQVVPEPSTLALLGLAGLGLCFLKRQR